MTKITYKRAFTIWANMLGYNRTDRRNDDVQKSFVNFIDSGACFR